MCNVACIAYYIVHDCVCVCKRFCYINMLGNMLPTCQHTQHTHTHARTHMYMHGHIHPHTHTKLAYISVSAL